MSNSGSAYVDSTSFSSDRKHTQSLAQDILYQQQPRSSSETMPDNASLNSYSSTASTLKSKLKPSSWTTKKVQEQSLKTQGRKAELKWPIYPSTVPGPNSYI